MLKGAADNALKAALETLAKYDAKSVSRVRKLDMSWVTEADQAIQQAVIASIQRAFPDHYVLGEETLDTPVCTGCIKPVRMNSMRCFSKQRWF